MKKQRLLHPDTQKLIDRLPFEIHGYKCESVLGSGAFSSVFKCYQPTCSRYFAAKAIPLEFEGPDHSVNVCDSESSALVQVNHPNIVKLYDSFREDNHLFLILQYCEHGSLQSRVKSGRGLGSDLLIPYMSQLLNALSYLHSKSISHRDIKPANVFLDSSLRPVLADFGFAIIRRGSELLDKFCGSLQYRAPESVQQVPHCPFKADVWALGVTFYEMACGSTPWPTYSPDILHKAIVSGDYKIPDHVDKGVAGVIRAMLTVDPAKRLSADELLRFPLFKEPREQKPSHARKQPHRDTPLCALMDFDPS